MSDKPAPFIASIPKPTGTLDSDIAIAQKSTEALANQTYGTAAGELASLQAHNDGWLKRNSAHLFVVACAALMVLALSVIFVR